MAQPTCAQLLKSQRDLVQIFGTTEVQYGDGYISVTNETSLLQRLNEFLSMLARCRVKQSEAVINAAPASRFITLPDNVYEVLSVYSGGRRLRQTTRDALDARRGTWYLDEGNDPLAWFRSGAKQIALDKIPVNSFPTLIAYSSSLTKLAAPTDVLTELPEDFAWLTPYGGALITAVVDSDNESQVRRAEMYRNIVHDMMSDLFRINSGDFATPVDLDMWVPRPVFQSPMMLNDKPYSSATILQGGGAENGS